MEPLGLGLIGYGGFGRFCLEVYAAMPDLRVVVCFSMYTMPLALCSRKSITEMPSLWGWRSAGLKVLLATFALRQADDAMAERLKAHLRRLGLNLGLLANFYDTRLAITPVRVK